MDQHDCRFHDRLGRRISHKALLEDQNWLKLTAFNIRRDMLLVRTSPAIGIKHPKIKDFLYPNESPEKIWFCFATQDCKVSVLPEKGNINLLKYLINRFQEVCGTVSSPEN